MSTKLSIRLSKIRSTINPIQLPIPANRNLAGSKVYHAPVLVDNSGAVVDARFEAVEFKLVR